MSYTIGYTFYALATGAPPRVGFGNPAPTLYFDPGENNYPCYYLDRNNQRVYDGSHFKIESYPPSISQAQYPGIPGSYWPAYVQFVITLPSFLYQFDFSPSYGPKPGGGYDNTAVDYPLKRGTFNPPPPPPSPPPPPAPAGSLFLTRDAHRRALAAGAGNGTPATGYFSNDAGHSFGSSVLDADATCADVSLLIDRHASRFSAFYTRGKPGSQALYAAFGPVVDGYPPDAAPAAARGISGLYPVACEHPTERGAALLLLVQGKSLVCAETGDYGENWTQAGTVAGSVDFSASGRAGLCFLGGTAFAAYASGKQIACAKSEDRGRTWTGCAPAGDGGPYSGLSLLGWQGTLYLLAFAAPASPGAAPVAALFVSEMLGAAWSVSAAALPKIGLPSALGVLPETAQLRLGLTHHSDDDTASWLLN